MSVRLRFDNSLESPLRLLQAMPPEKASDLLSRIFETGEGGAPARPLDTEAEIISAELERTRESRVVKDLKRKNALLISHVEGLENKVDHLLQVSAHQPSLITTAVAPPAEDRSQAVAIILLSDWHLEERVRPDTINGLNAYSIDIARARVSTVFRNSLRLIELNRTGVEINNVVIFLIGDLITGYIHEELKEVNEVSPTMATLIAYEMVVDGINYLLDNANLETLSVCCMYGNHGRTTQKMQIATGYANSFEWMLFHQIANHYRNNPRIKFDIPSGPIGYVRIYDKVIRYIHGDSIKYQGGIGGISVPVRKHIDRLNQHHRADMTYMGHWHQYTQPFEDVVINGSVIGPNPYSVRLGLPIEPPRQTFHLLDSKRGFTVRTPIFCD